MKFLLMMRFKKTICFIVAFLSIGALTFAQNDCFPEKDKSNQILVYDESDIFSASEERALNQRLVQISNNTSNQIVVVVVNDLCGMDKAMYATDLGQAWGVGRKGQDNGIVILIKPTGGKGQRKTFIATGYGLEGVIPDATAKLVVENEMIPNFKQGQFYRGVDAALDVLVPLAKQEFNYQAYNQKVRKVQKRRKGGSFSYLLILFGIFFLLSRVFSARSYAQRNGTSLWTAFMLGSILGGGLGGSSRSGGWDDFNSGGGGFGGFGGGGFGGGGAGGDW